MNKHNLICVYVNTFVKTWQNCTVYKILIFGVYVDSQLYAPVNAHKVGRSVYIASIRKQITGAY